MPPRLKIVSPRHPLRPEEDPSVYTFTSPLRADFITRKLLKFTVPVSMINYQGESTVDELVENMQKFDDVRIHGNVVFVFAGGSHDKKARETFEKLSDEYRERFYFFNAIDMTSGPSIFAVGNNFTKHYHL